MGEKRIRKNAQLREAAIEQGMQIGSKIVIRERSLLKDYSYVTREIRYAVVLALYPYHFYCRMADGRKESFRYNEFLGQEARMIRLQKKGAAAKAEEKGKKAVA